MQVKAIGDTLRDLAARVGKPLAFLKARCC